ncbi:hypothetical protein RHEC894_CH01334 [Rhizobium sp. CIAT894]|uniref:DUF1127 domain-containing protein n=1 Tax=Rhizobium sp. CIAT894 TaxID=2020312 RepID=UPI000A1F1145|nr:DUF1127 domain-containing protein [Rhizobium sp. CIAT894]ARM87669.1 hypothetical protein RHEC894_CH01334 [Rhizobium sp. CIAT894]
MYSSKTTIPTRTIRSSRPIHSGLLLAVITAARWLVRKMNERRNCNALMELSDAQLKDIGLSRGQTESDVHVYSRS